MLINYKSVLKEAWSISISNPFLWLFGAFASFVSLENVYEIILTQINQAKQSGDFFFKISSLYQTQSTIFDKHIYNLNLLRYDFASYLIFVLIIAVIMIFIWMAFCSQISIIKSAELLYHGKKATNNSLFFHSQEKFWPVFIINILVKLLIFAAFIILSLPLLYFILTTNFCSLFYANVLFFLFFTVFAVILSFVAAYAVNYIVLKDYNVFQSLSAAWRLFTKNILISLEIALILFFLKIISLFIIIACCLLFFGPFGLILFYSFLTADMVGVVLWLILILLVLVIISLFINAFFTVFYLSSWTITFIKLTEETLTGKILNLLYKIPVLFRDLADKHKIHIDKKTIKAETAKFVIATEKQAKIISKKLGEKYKEYKPVAVKQSKILAKNIQEEYKKMEPELKKQADKIMKKIVSQTKTKPKTLKKSKTSGSRKKKKQTASKTSSKKSKSN